jgi:ethanolamine utilization protein EutN
MPLSWASSTASTWRNDAVQLARVIGDVVATHKQPALEGLKLLVIQPFTAAGVEAGRPLVAVDAVGAGVGEQVFFVRGKEASFPFHPTEVPADAAIVGIVDQWSLSNSECRIQNSERRGSEKGSSTPSEF